MRSDAGVKSLESQVLGSYSQGQTMAQSRTIPDAAVAEPDHACPPPPGCQDCMAQCLLCRSALALGGQKGLLQLSYLCLTVYDRCVDGRS